MKQRERARTKKQNDQVYRLRRAAVCEELGRRPGRTATEILREGAWSHAWGAQATYGQVYHVLRQLVEEGVVQEDVAAGPTYALVPGIGTRVALEGIRELEELFPSWAGLEEIRAELEGLVLQRVAGLP